MNMRPILFVLVLALPASAQELFPRFSVTAGASPAKFETNRPLSWLGIGAAYHYFRLDVDVAQADLSGALDMTIQGPEAYLRVAF